MKAILCIAHGGPEELVWRETPTPTPGPDQVLVKLGAAAVNFPDALVIAGRYQVQPPLPFSPGCEGVGVISAVGRNVTRLRPGRRVMFSTTFGAFAEEVVVEARSAYLIPDAMPDEDAAGFLLAYATAYHALKQRAALRAGETLLILGAGGGVGLAGVEVGRAMGARVIACASSADKLEACKARGADVLVEYGEPATLRSLIAEATGGRGPDVIYDPVGGAFAEPAFRSIAYNGRYVVIGFAAGSIPSLPLNLPLLKSASLVGAIVGVFMDKEPDIYEQNVEDLLALYAKNRLKPVVSQVLPLRQAADAIRALTDRRAVGKIVLTA
ncbi:MAG: NADPH:quinone oxidoreductase family protein [Hyphomonadaceae bacterium]